MKNTFSVGEKLRIEVPCHGCREGRLVSLGGYSVCFVFTESLVDEDRWHVFGNVSSVKNPCAISCDELESIVCLVPNVQVYYFDERSNLWFYIKNPKLKVSIGSVISFDSIEGNDRSSTCGKLILVDDNRGVVFVREESSCSINNPVPVKNVNDISLEELKKIIGLDPLSLSNVDLEFKTPDGWIPASKVFGSDFK